MYHLTRVAHWIQNSSVHHYATHTTAQLELAPLHEFNMLHLHLLADTDRLDGFVQLAAFVDGDRRRLGADAPAGRVERRAGRRRR